MFDRNLKVGLGAGVLVIGMVGLAYASVPLYQLFCQVTGFGGTTQEADIAPGDAGTGRMITVEFDSNVNRGLPWRFKPEQRRVTLPIGEERLAAYRAENTGDKPITGTATFNVTPFKAGPYFTKIACFCFEEQTLQPGESVSMPVSFFVDPEILDDPNLNDVTTITLSYTFFNADEDSTASATVSGATNRQSTAVSADTGAL